MFLAAAAAIAAALMDVIGGDGGDGCSCPSSICAISELARLFTEVAAEVNDPMECFNMDLPLKLPSAAASFSNRVDDELEGPQLSVDDAKKGFPAFRRRNSVFNAVL